MIKSITFPKRGEGYIYKKVEKPEKPEHPKNGISNRDYFRCRSYEERMEVYKSLMADYKKEMEYYNEHKGEYALKCSNLMVGRTFKFEPNKVNVIFGPNGCGKTTILKALAGNALIEDGWTKPMVAYELHTTFDDIPYADLLPKKIEKRKHNSCKIDWDGTPIYYENFAYTEQNSRELGDMVGSIFGNSMDEFAYHMSRGTMNMGSKTAMIINKVLNICEKPKTYDDIFAPYEKEMRGFNTEWTECYKCQMDYFRNFPKANSGEPNTILFDEIDKSLDIENVLYLYTELLPKFVEKYGVQFILVSHSPIILSDKVFNDKRYNIVSMDKDYTERCRNLLK